MAAAPTASSPHPDVAVVGPGAAGLYPALCAPRAHAGVVLLSPTPLAQALWRSEGRCRGLVCDDGRVISASAVVIATGGAAALWARTTNPPGSQGVGPLLAHAAGAALADLELLQFHPTAVIGVPGREGFPITEAIRGEGATPHAPSGARFVNELAPRDEAARAIQRVLQASGGRSVGLDMRAI